MPDFAQPPSPRDIVITGLGVISPIGIGHEAFWQSLREGRSGVRPVTLFDTSEYPVKFGAEVQDFDPRSLVRPRKSLKVMSREIQFGFAAADLAMSDAGLTPGAIEPARLGVVFGAEMIYCELTEFERAYRRAMIDGKFEFRRWGEAAMAEIFPLWLLRNLPNMVACQIAIVQEAQGPNNTLNLGDISSLAAIAEAVRVMERGRADAMIAGGVGARLHPTTLSFRGHQDLSHRNENPAAASRPFDAGRDGFVNGEGAAALLLETRQHAEGRGAKLLGRILSQSSAHEPLRNDQPRSGSAVRQSIQLAMQRANLRDSDLSHVNAFGLSTSVDDVYEAQAIRSALGDVPVTALKSYFGHLGAGACAMELVASVLALQHGEVPITLNFEQPDPACPVNVVHGEPLSTDGRAALKISTSRLGHAAALAIAREA
ncbi:MAG: beta-ketoacyl-[acyl-carrier-protein] synthase family protein [Pirellulales bacterium]|nr:beta-ketoacyl-[acyl-carrier-protein] synthase family protein [Pirellulales bacterium]